MEDRKRVITGVLLLGGALLSYRLWGHYAVQALTAATALVAYHEFLLMLIDKRQNSEQQSIKTWSALGLASVFLALFSWRQEGTLLTLYFSFLFFLLLALWFSHRDKEQSAELVLKINLRDAMIQSFGLFYLVGFLSFVPIIHKLPQGPAHLLFLLFLIWGGDIGAYYGGRRFGKRLLAPTLSPKKTWEGSICGILMALVACTLLNYFFNLEHKLLGLALIVILTSVVAQAGDLLESLIKRVAHVKDSGTLFPGHGGVFDRFDSLILAAPFYYFFLAVLRL